MRAVTDTKNGYSNNDKDISVFEYPIACKVVMSCLFISMYRFIKTSSSITINPVNNGRKTLMNALALVISVSKAMILKLMSAGINKKIICMCFPSTLKSLDCIVEYP